MQRASGTISARMTSSFIMHADSAGMSQATTRFHTLPVFSSAVSKPPSGPAMMKANDAADALTPRIRSVVRVDASTHKLIRVFQAVRPPQDQTPRDPDPVVQKIVEDAAKSYDVNPLLVHSVISVESNF